MIKFIKNHIIGVTIIGCIITFYIGMFIGIFPPGDSIYGNSMLPSYKNGDHLIQDCASIKYKSKRCKQELGLYQYRRGDVVVLSNPKNIFGKDYVKRIIAIPGDTVMFHFGKVYINDYVTKEPYILEQEATFLYKGDVFEYTKKYLVPNNKYVVLGDNRRRSLDSRSFGFVDKSLIQYRVYEK